MTSKNDVLQLTLDLNTADPELSLSEGNRKVTGTDKAQPSPDQRDVPTGDRCCVETACLESATGSVAAIGVSEIRAGSPSLTGGGDEGLSQTQ
ncbi:uncharacterized protein ACWYII_041819 [Salvelinus alpinus]